MKYFAFILAFLAVIAACEPGMRTLLSSTGVKTIKEAVQPQLISEIYKMQFPEIKEKVHSPVGKIEIKLNNFNVEEFGIESSAVSIAPPNRGTITLTGVAMHLHLKWHYKAKLGVSDHGHAEVHTHGASIVLGGNITRDPKTGEPFVNIDDTGFDCGELSVKLHGGASWLYNLFMKTFEHQLRSEINHQFRKTLGSTVTSMLKQALAKVHPTYDLKYGVSLTYALADDPIVTPDFGNRLVAGSVAEFYVTKEGPGHSPYTPSAMPPTAVTKDPCPMLELMINEFSLNTLLYAYIRAGNGHIVLDPNTAPPEALALLISFYYCDPVPGLCNQYGYDANLSLAIDIDKLPTLSLQPDGFHLSATTLMTFSVIANGTTTPAFGLNFNIVASGTLGINGTNATSINATAHLDSLKASATVASSSVGDINTDSLKQLIDSTIATALPDINDQLAVGFPLPLVDGVALVDPKFYWGSNFVSILSDFTYHHHQKK